MPVTLYELLQAHFGVRTSWRQNPEVSQVEVTVTKVVSHNPNRVGLTILNSGANRIFLSPLNTVAVGAGLVLVSYGGAFTLTWDEDFEFVNNEFFAIADGAASAVTVIEVYTL